MRGPEQSGLFLWSNMSNAVGDKFNLELFLNARELALKACHLFNEGLEEGMNERDGHTLMDNILLSLGSERKWHPTKFRYGKDTIKSFRDKSEVEKGIQKGDLYFLDIGPVFHDHEADIGRTYTFQGQNALSTKSEIIFKKLEKIWKEENLTGELLYKRALEVCDEEKVVLNPKMAGHRIGDFPHALHYKGNLLDYKDYLDEELWVLEIHILNREGTMGSFYEDILRKKIS